MRRLGWPLRGGLHAKRGQDETDGGTQKVGAGEESAWFVALDQQREHELYVVAPHHPCNPPHLKQSDHHSPTGDDAHEICTRCDQIDENT